MQYIPYDPAADPYQYLGQAFGSMFGGLDKQYQTGLQGQDLQRLQQYQRNMQVAQQAADITGGGHWPGSQPGFPQMQSQKGQDMWGNALMQQLLNPYAIPQAQANLQYTRTQTKSLKAPRPATLSPIMKMVKEGLITQAEGRKLARKDSDNDLGEKDIISIMHTIERALEATYDAIGSPIPGREDQRRYYVGQLEHYKSRLDKYRSARRGATESYYSPSNPPLENLPLGTLEVNRTPPKAPRPYLNSYWGILDNDTKSLVTRAITQGATQIEILAALRARGAIK